MKVLLKIVGFGLLALVVGVGSAWRLIDDGAAFNVSQVGPWKTWPSESRLDADPYTRARMARSGQLPVTSSTALTFTAREDSDGDALSPECDYEIAGRPFNALWWSIAAFDDAGAPIKNKAERHAFNSKNIALLPDGSFRVRLAPRARPGNWLPTADADGLMLTLKVLKPQNAAEAGSRETRSEILPVIRRIACG
ncbi:MAG: DUF1214 domain-containing protein [Hyphomicrobiales bacterium]|nr:DUF1214 domain-containing protein [Hyphomicrobiales bacterium]